MTTFKWVCIIGGLVYCAILGIVYFAQRSILFPIPQTQRTSPEASGFPQAQDHILTTEDGEKIVAWHVPSKEGRPVVVFFHGNGDILAWRVPRFRELTSDGTGLIAIAFRGYAGSSGTPSEQGLMRDGAAAYEFAAANYASEKIIVWGFSLGTGVATAIAAERPVGKLILEAPYTSTADIAAASFPFLPVRLLMKDQFHSDDRIGKVTAPILMIHGERDAAIPIRFGERLFSSAHEPKTFIRLQGGGHENLDNYGAIAAVRRFINGADR